MTAVLDALTPDRLERIADREAATVVADLPTILEPARTRPRVITLAQARRKPAADVTMIHAPQLTTRQDEGGCDER